MLKTSIHTSQLIFDIETIPDLETAMRVYPELAERAAVLNKLIDSKKHDGEELAVRQKAVKADLLKELYLIAGGTESKPEPFLKYFLHKVVSISGISRKIVPVSDEYPIGIDLRLFTLAMDENTHEAEIIDRFLRGVGERKPQLIGWCSTLFDMPCLLQRALINKLSFPKLQRPSKPWEGADYFSNGSDYNIDLMEIISSRSGQSKATLNEFARALRIPGKLGMEGADVANAWLNDGMADIAAYNECDTATTYLIWMNELYLSGQISAEDLELECEQFKTLLLQRAEETGTDHLKGFVTEWERLQGIVPEVIEPESDIDQPSAEADQVDQDHPVDESSKGKPIDFAAISKVELYEMIDPESLDQEK